MLSGTLRREKCIVGGSRSVQQNNTAGFTEVLFPRRAEEGAGRKKPLILHANEHE